MYLKDILDNKKFWFIVLLFLFLSFLSLFSNNLVEKIVTSHYDRIADKVIEKLQKEYCPSPYGPGIDPDKIDLDKFLKQ